MEGKEGNKPKAVTYLREFSFKTFVRDDEKVINPIKLQIFIFIKQLTMIMEMVSK